MLKITLKSGDVMEVAAGTTVDALCREIFFAFSRANKAILQMTMSKASLEDIFLELTGKASKKGQRFT